MTKEGIKFKMKGIQQKNTKKIIVFSIVICFFIIMMLLILKQIGEIRNSKEELSNSQYNVESAGTTYNYQKGNAQQANNDIKNINSKNNDVNNYNDGNITNVQTAEEKSLLQGQDDKILDEYKGYKVSAKLEIPKINLETYILKQYSTQALKISVTKFWGAEPNTVGNFCIAGHNFQNKNMFHNLRKLTKGDKLTISDNTVGKVDYEIYDTYQVKPEEVSCLSQKTNGKREVTLITCTMDSQKRIIVKAREIN